MNASAITTLTQLLECAREERGSALALAQLGNDGSVVDSRTFEDLHRNALRLASALGGRPRRERVLLAPAAPIAFVEGFFGLIYAGLIPVPAPSPRTSAAYHRLEVQSRDCGASWALVGDDDSKLMRSRVPGDQGLRLLSVESLLTAEPVAIPVAPPVPDDVAFLQYTSGSTSNPRGVVVTHRALFTNEVQIAEVFGHDASTVFGNWLPLFHDMGLIGGVLQPLYLRVACYHLTPMQFHTRPARWLDAISRYGITTTGGPNSAYDACVDRIPAAERDFDLGSWKVAFNGAEPVKARTLRRFVTAFEHHGFDPSAFLPCYGMAEATLLVSGVPSGRGRLYDHDEAVVSCGIRPQGITCAIAAPLSEDLAPEGQEGEILIAGDNVSTTYWGEDEKDRAARFSEYMLDGRTISFLRSGDFGFLRGEELFVTGRLKDLIIREGRNYHPSDLESAALEAEILGKRKNAAAFALAEGSIVVLIECADAAAPVLDVISRDVRRRILERCGVHAECIGLVLRGRLPVTTSGKIRRGVCRQMFEEGGFERIHVDMVSADRLGATSEETEFAAVHTPDALIDFSANFLSERLGRRLSTAELDVSFADLALDSIDAVTLGMALSQTFGITVPGVRVLAASSLLRLLEDLPSARSPVIEPEFDSTRVSATAEALLLLSQKEADRAFGNVTVAFDLPMEISHTAVQEALSRLVRCHPALRSRFLRSTEGLRLAPLADLRSDEALYAPIETTADSLQGRLERALATPFDLFVEAPMRVFLYRVTGGRQTIQFVMHHAAVDLQSLAIVIRELCRELAGRPVPEFEVKPAAPPPFTPKELEAARTYWRQALPGPVQRLQVPRSATLSAAPSGRFLPFELGEDDTGRLIEYTRARQCSLVAVLLAVYQSALATYTGERRVLTLVPFRGRETPAAQRTIGCFVNPLPVVTDVEADDSLDTLVAKVRRSILRLLELQAVPISEAGLEVERDGNRSPFLQFGFAPQSVGTETGDDVAAIAIRGFEQVITVEGLEIRPRSLDHFEPAADMLFSVARFRGSLMGAFEYDANRLDVDFATGVLSLVRALLRGVAADRALGAQVASRIDPEQEGWGPPRLRTGAAPRVETYSLFHLLERRRRAWNSVCAIEHGGVRWSYGELFAQAELAAARLQGRGVGQGDRVAILSNLTPAGIAVILGIWASGALYCPIDPLYPAERREAMLALLAPKLIIEQSEALLASSDEVSGPASIPEPAEIQMLPAYLIFTSGSTGRPKGVLISHRAICNMVGAQRLFGIEPGMRVLQACSPGFDASIFEILLALAFGGTLLLPDKRIASGESLVEAWQWLGPDVAVLPPSLAAALQDVEPPPNQLILAGEPCPPSLVDTWASRCRLYNAYGPTETTIWATVEPLTHAAAFPYIGSPIDGVSVAVVDEELRPLPIGAPGELVIGGPGVSMGYLDDPNLTAERFVRPHAGGDVFYRSGDRARLTSDGRVQFLGRIDRQIKLNGVRIELGEIEAVIERSPEVRQALVIDFHTDYGPRIAAFVLTKDAGITEVDLRKRIACFLPPTFIPSVISFCDAFPLDAHGKIDTRALRSAIASTREALGDDLETPLLRSIARVCNEVFGVAPESSRDNLLLLGVHSLNTVRFVGKLSSEIQREIPLALVFERPVVADFAAAVAQLAPLSPSAPVDSDAAPEDASGEAEYPLTPVQRDLWFAGEAGRPADYVIPLAFDLKGPLDSTLLRLAVDHVVASHSSLRGAVVDRDGTPCQVFLPTWSDVLEITDFTTANGALDTVRQDLRERITAPSDSGGKYRLRLLLYRLSEKRHVLGIIGHHIFLDGWSMGLFLADLGRTHAALQRGAPLPDLGSENALWRYLDAETLPAAQDSKLQKWRTFLAGAEAEQIYEPDRDAALEAHVPHRTSFAIPLYHCVALLEAAQAAYVSLFSVVTAALALVAARQQGGDATILSVVAANRDTPERRNLIGCLATSLPIPVSDLSEDIGSEALWQNVHRQILRAGEISGPAISEIGAVLPGSPSGRRSPLLSTMIVQNERTFHALNLGNAAIRADLLPWRFPQEPRADLLLEVTANRDELTLALETDPRVLTPKRTERIRASLEHVLSRWAEGVRAPVSEFEVLSPAEHFLVLHRFNATSCPYDLEPPLHRLVEAAAERTPDACAVSCDKLAISYRLFEQKVNRLANALIATGLPIGAPVGVCSPPGLGLVVALHGIMKAGGAYVPLDPAAPDERLAWSVEDLGIRWIVGELRPELWRSLEVPQILHPLPEIGDDRRPDIAVRRSDPAYILLTSGSTGKPKAAINRHESIVNRLLWMQEAMPLYEGDRVLQKTTFTFDVSVWEFFWPLTVGATLCTLCPGQNLDPTEIYSALQRERISTVHFVPSALAEFLQSRPSFSLPDLRRVVVSGEELTSSLRDAAIEALEVELHNLYGPTEAAIDVTHWRCRRGDGPGRVPIGAPIANTQIYVLDKRGRPSPVGVLGEIFIGGVQVGSGYAGNEEETRRRFGASPFAPFPTSRLYQTGDIGRWTEHGWLEYFGRSDDQIKIRGIRVELGEIVAAMKALPGVLEARVLVQGDSSHRRLTGFVVHAEGTRVDTADLRSRLSDWLPSALVPSEIVAIDRLPLLPNGKIDNTALARLASGQQSTRLIEAPSSEMESTILGIWCELLGQRQIGVTDNFFDVGGNSLLLMQVQTRLTRVMQRAVPVIDLLKNPTVRKLAATLAPDGDRASDAVPDAAVPDTSDASAVMRAGVDRLAKLARLRRSGR